MGPNGGSKRLKLRKTLHLADSIRCGNRSRENPPPGTSNFLLYLGGVTRLVGIPSLGSGRLLPRKRGCFGG
jgi:hypothetical protein